jgi:Ca2+-binding EF-hand superfamily protein
MASGCKDKSSCKLALSTSGMAKKVREDRDKESEKLFPTRGRASKRASAQDLALALKELRKAGKKGNGVPDEATASSVHNQEDLALCAKMAKKYGLPPEDVWWKMLEFNAYDTDGNRELDRNEFQKVIRIHINMPGNGPLPKHLLNWHWLSAEKSMDNSLDFEEFLLWTMRTAYTEEALVPDVHERLLRQVARENGVSITEAEKMKTAFDRFDLDKTGFLGLSEFRYALFELLGAKNESDISSAKLQRWWREIDTDASGSASFEEFMVWYITNFSRNGPLSGLHHI